MEGHAITSNDTDRLSRLASSTLIIRNKNGGLASIDGRYEGEPIYIGTEQNPSKAQRAFVGALNLPFVTEGKIAARGSRETIGIFDPDNRGYAAFRTHSGDILMSLLPIDGANVSDVVELCCFIDEHTHAQGVMARPLGIHLYRGQLRVLFEMMKGRRFPSAARFGDEEVPAAIHAQYMHAITTAGIGIPLDRYEHGLIEADYMFIDEGRFRMGLPVRARLFADAVRRGNIFRLK